MGALSNGSTTGADLETTPLVKAHAMVNGNVASHTADIVVVGAGIIGCALAVAFGKQGRSVILLERSLKEPDRIVGELLQPGGVRALKKLGLSGKEYESTVWIWLIRWMQIVWKG
jgi:squalene monooxygenase